MLVSYSTVLSSVKNWQSKQQPPTTLICSSMAAEEPLTVASDCVLVVGALTSSTTELCDELVLVADALSSLLEPLDSDAAAAAPATAGGMTSWLQQAPLSSVWLTADDDARTSTMATSSLDSSDVDDTSTSMSTANLNNQNNSNYYNGIQKLPFTVIYLPVWRISFHSHKVGLCFLQCFDTVG